MQTSKYLLATERDAEWGLTISTVGREEIAPGEEYPTKGHADGYYFDLQKEEPSMNTNCFTSQKVKECSVLPISRKQRSRLETSSCSFPVNGIAIIHQAPRLEKLLDRLQGQEHRRPRESRVSFS